MGARAAPSLLRPSWSHDDICKVANTEGCQLLTVILTSQGREKHPPAAVEGVFSSGFPEVGREGYEEDFKGGSVLQLPECLQGTQPAKGLMSPSSLTTGSVSAWPLGRRDPWAMEEEIPPLFTSLAQQGFNAGTALSCKSWHVWQAEPCTEGPGPGFPIGCTTGLLGEEAGPHPPCGSPSFSVTRGHICQAKSLPCM